MKSWRLRFDSRAPSSLRANGSRERAPDDRLREAIHFSARRTMDCFATLAMTGYTSCHDLRPSLRLRHADARLRSSDGAAAVAQRGFSRAGALPRPALSDKTLSRTGAGGRSRGRRVRRIVPAAPAGRL